MLIYNVRKNITAMNSIEAFLGMYLKPFKNFIARVLSGVKSLGCTSWY